MIRKDLVLEGARVRLEPLAEQHLEQLLEACNDPALWEFTFQANPFITTDSARAWLANALSAEKTVPFAIVDRATGKAIGSTRLFEIEPAHRKLEIGFTFIAKPYWRTRVNTECKYLLMRYAFETWNAVRVQFKAEAINARSRAAILRLGATYEGTFRNYRIRPDGERRDIAWFSIIADEWPAVAERLAARTEAAVALQRQ